MPTRVCLVKAIVFQVVMYGNKTPSSESYDFSTGHVWMWEIDHKESWVLKNWCFWTVVLEKTLESPLDCKRSNQSILKEISPEYSLEGLMLKLKLQYFGHLMWRTDSLEKTLMLGKIEGKEKGWQRMRWLDGITDSMDMTLSRLRELVMDRDAWHAAVHEVTKSWTRLNWTELKHAWHRVCGLHEEAAAAQAWLWCTIITWYWVCLPLCTRSCLRMEATSPVLSAWLMTRLAASFLPILRPLVRAFFGVPEGTTHGHPIEPLWGGRLEQ